MQVVVGHADVLASPQRLRDRVVVESAALQQADAQAPARQPPGQGDARSAGPDDADIGLKGRTVGHGRKVNQHDGALVRSSVSGWPGVAGHRRSRAAR